MLDFELDELYYQLEELADAYQDASGTRKKELETDIMELEERIEFLEGVTKRGNEEIPLKRHSMPDMDYWMKYNGLKYSDFI